MQEKLVIHNSLLINAPIEEVWDALVNPSKTVAYMYGCEAHSDWKIGSPLNWVGEYEGNKMTFVHGKVLEFTPPLRLVFTVTDTQAQYEDIPENYIRTVYELKTENEATLLSVMQDGFEAAANGQKRYQDVYNNGEGWNPVLLAIKNLVEGGV